MFSFSTSISVLSPRSVQPQSGPLPCPSFRVSGAGCASPYLALHPPGWGQWGQHCRDLILQE